MKQKLFVDTNILCAQYNPDDRLYKKAKTVKPLLQKYQPIISNFILLETYTVLSQRASRKIAIDFGERIRQKHQYAIVWIDKKLEQEVWEIFTSIKDKNFSYVDASILAVMKKEKIKYLVSFDESFVKLQKQFTFKLIGA